MAASLKKIRKKLEKELDEKRYEHTLGVAYTAALLASVHGESEEKALTAGFLHDCAKCVDHKEKLRLCEKHHVKLSEVERRNLFLLHAKAGRILAKKEYDVRDEDVLNAIENHTTGRPGMSRLEKIIFISDYIEPGRNHASNLPDIRRLAFQDLDQALLMVLGDTLAYLRSTGKEIDQMTQVTYDFYAEHSHFLSEKQGGCSL